MPPIRHLAFRFAVLAAGHGLALLAPRAALAQGPTLTRDSIMSGAALREDVRVLRAALETVHPGLHRYVDRRELGRRFDALNARLAQGATLETAYLEIARLVSTIRCGHTFLNPNNQSRAVAAAMFRGTPRVPFYFRWLDGRMIVTHDVSATRAFGAGTEVLAINGMRASAILARLLPYSRTDGANEAKRIANLAVQPGARWQEFDVYFPLVIPPPVGAWTFELRDTDGRTRTVTAPPTDATQRLAAYDSVMRTRSGRDSAGPPWSIRVDDDGIAVLTMPTWVTYNDSWNWAAWVDSAFAQVIARDARALVVDLRGNEGGTGVGDVILAHLADRPVTLGRLRRYTRYRQLPDSLRRHLDTWDRSFDDWGASATPSAERPGFYRLTRFDEDSTGTVIRPRTPRFTGKVFVLVGAENSSATFEFALAVRELRLGTLVGQPTGGNQRGINGGAFYFLRLPNSRIEVDLPIIAQFAASERPNGGIAPDIAVRTTARDIASGRDPEMDAVRRALSTARRDWP